MAKKDYSKLARDIVRLVGGEENVESLTHCVTRLRFKLKDEEKAAKDELIALNGVLQVVKASGQYQVVIGQDVTLVYEEIGKCSGILSGDSSKKEKEENKEKKTILNVAIDTISGIFLPFISAFMATGLLKGILVIFTTLGILSDQSTTYALLFSMADGMLTFLPIFLAHTAGKKFGANPYVSMAIASALVYPNITALFSAGTAVSFLGIPVTLISYQSSVIPIVVAVFIQAKLEKLIEPRIHQAVRGVIAPIISLVVVGLFTFMVIEPVSNILAVGLSNGVSALLSICPPVGGALLGFLYPLMLIFGFHWGIIPLAMNNFATMGGDPLFAITMTANFAVAGCTLGVLLKTKKSDVRELSLTAFVSALLGGVTEPAIYGVLLKYKRPFAVVCIMSGIGGIILASSGAFLTAMLTGSLMTLPALIAMMGAPVAVAAAIGVIGGAAGTFLFGYHDGMEESGK